MDTSSESDDLNPPYGSDGESCTSCDDCIGSHNLRMVLSGTDINPLSEDENGEAQATQFGYAGKLAIKWYWHSDPEDSSKSLGWSQSPDFWDGTVDVRPKSEAMPILHYFTFHCDAWRPSTLTIDDPPMREAIAHILDGYESYGPASATRSLTVSEPWRPLVHRWDALKTYYARLNNGMPAKHALGAFLAYAAPIVAEPVLALERAKSTKKIKNKDIWVLFPIGTSVMVKMDGLEKEYRVLRCLRDLHSLDNPAGWSVYVNTVATGNGEIGENWRRVQILKFKGYKKVKDLLVYPLSLF
jgi:hypothetical protein